MHHCACLCACLAPLVFFYFYFFISFLAPSSASSGLKRAPYRRGVVTTISVLEFSKQHSPLLKYRIPQSIENLG